MKRERKEYLMDAWDVIKAVLPILIFIAIVGIFGRFKTLQQREHPAQEFPTRIYDITDSAGWGHPVQEGGTHGE